MIYDVLKASVYIAMLGPVIVIGAFVVYLVVADIVHSIKLKEQQKRFAEVYQMCIDKHGLEFAKKVYDGCTKPLWIGMDKMIAVFEHHCGIKNELSRKL